MPVSPFSRRIDPNSLRQLSLIAKRAPASEAYGIAPLQGSAMSGGLGALSSLVYGGQDGETTVQTALRRMAALGGGNLVSALSGNALMRNLPHKFMSKNPALATGLMAGGSLIPGVAAGIGINRGLKHEKQSDHAEDVLNARLREFGRVQRGGPEELDIRSARTQDTKKWLYNSPTALNLSAIPISSASQVRGLSRGGAYLGPSAGSGILGGIAGLTALTRDGQEGESTGDTALRRGLAVGGGNLTAAITHNALMRNLSNKFIANRPMTSLGLQLGSVVPGIAAGLGINSLLSPEKKSNAVPLEAGMSMAGGEAASGLGDILSQALSGAAGTHLGTAAVGAAGGGLMGLMNKGRGESRGKSALRHALAGGVIGGLAPLANVGSGMIHNHFEDQAMAGSGIDPTDPSASLMTPPGSFMENVGRQAATFAPHAIPVAAGYGVNEALRPKSHGDKPSKKTDDKGKSDKHEKKSMNRNMSVLGQLAALSLQPRNKTAAAVPLKPPSLQTMSFDDGLRRLAALRKQAMSPTSAYLTSTLGGAAAGGLTGALSGGDEGRSRNALKMAIIGALLGGGGMGLARNLGGADKPIQGLAAGASVKPKVGLPGGK